MSGYYSAGQFDHAFKPTLLKNWQYGVNPFPGKYAVCSPLKCCPTKFIACDNGHLFPEVCRNWDTSPWGDYATSIWEQAKPCCCIKRLRNPEKYKDCCPQPEETENGCVKLCPKPVPGSFYPTFRSKMIVEECCAKKKLPTQQMKPRKVKVWKKKK